MKTERDQKQPLSFRQWWDHVGTENAIRVAEELGTSLAYFRFIRYGLKRCSEPRALAIMEAAHRLTPGFVPDFLLLTEPVKHQFKPDQNGPKQPRKLGIQPSREFLSAMGGQK